MNPIGEPLDEIVRPGRVRGTGAAGQGDIGGVPGTGAAGQGDAGRVPGTGDRDAQPGDDRPGEAADLCGSGTVTNEWSAGGDRGAAPLG